MNSFICVLFKPKPVMSTTVNKSVYTPEWVEKLYRGCQRNCRVPFRFVCITDHRKEQFSNNIEVVPFKYKKHVGTWLCINEVLRADLELGTAVMMGLDTVVLGDITGLFSYKGPLALLKPLSGTLSGWNGVSVYNDLGRLWERYRANPEKADSESRYQRWARHQGSENLWWLKMVPDHDLLPDVCPDVDIRSYKYEREKCETADISFFQGRHKPDTAPEAWVKKHWR